MPISLHKVTQDGPFGSPADLDQNWKIIEEKINDIEVEQGDMGSAISALGISVDARIGAMQGVIDGGATLLAEAIASNSSAIDLTGLTDFYHYFVLYDGVFLQSGTNQLGIRTSSDNGSSFDSGSLDYATGGFDSGGSGLVTLGPSVSGYSRDGHVFLFDVTNASRPTTIKGECIQHSTNTATYSVRAAARRENAVVNAIRFMSSTGNIASGKFSLYGLKRIP